MSKLSFRARALDASKPMPIYLAEELPDLPDYSAINRAVPQMPSGMEKEEESEHHLQRAISGTGLIIPTPEVCEVTDLQFYERCYPPDYKMPKQHIHMQPLWEEQEAPEYDIDSEDERWLKQQRHPELTELLFEQMMDKLEKCSGQTVVTLGEAKLLLERKDDLVIAVYDYWLNKRLNTQHPLILSVKTESRPGQSSNNPYLAFRRRTEKMQTRKNRKNDESSYEKMLKLRRELARALTLLQMVARREEAKRDLVRLTAQLAEKRYQARDFTNHVVHPPPRVGYSGVVVSAARRSPFPHLAPATTLHDTRQREKRPYKRRKHRHPTIGALGVRESGCTSSEEDGSICGVGGLSVGGIEGSSSPPHDGPFAFRRKPGCYYQMPTTTLCGDPVDPEDPAKEGLYEHEIDVRHRYTLTSLSTPWLRCVGFARRRSCRGGRIALDRIATPLDDLWPNLPFAAHTQYADSHEEVDLETKVHRSPKEMSRDFHTSGRYPWRHAFRKHLAKDPHLWTMEDCKPDPDDCRLTVDDCKLNVDDCKFNTDDFKLEPEDKMDIDIPQDSDISVRTVDVTCDSDMRDSEVTNMELDRAVRDNLDRVVRKRSWSRCSEDSYESDDSLQPVEKEFENFFDEVNKKWLHFRPVTPPPAPEPPSGATPLCPEAPLAVELRCAEPPPVPAEPPFTTAPFTLADLYSDVLPPEADNSTSSADMTDELLADNFTGLTEAQVESILSETDLKALDAELKDRRIAEDILDELVKDVDVKDSFLCQGQGLEGRVRSGALRRRAADAFGSTVVSMSADRESIYLDTIEPKVERPATPPKKIATPKQEKVKTEKDKEKIDKEKEKQKEREKTEREKEKMQPSPVPNSKIIVEEVNEVPHLSQIKLEKKKSQDTIEEVQLAHGVQLKTVQTKHSPLKKHIITSAAARRSGSSTSNAAIAANAAIVASATSVASVDTVTVSAAAQSTDSHPHILTVATSDSLKVRVQNPSVSASSGGTVVGLVGNGPFQTSAPLALALPLHRQDATGNPSTVQVSVCGTPTARRSAPLVHLTTTHKPVHVHSQSHQPLVVASVASVGNVASVANVANVANVGTVGVHAVPHNKLKVLHAHPLTPAQRTHLIANRGIGQLPAVVSLATLGEAKGGAALLKAAPGALTQFFEIKGTQLAKGPHLVNVVRQPQPGKTTMTRIDLGESKKRQVVAAFDGGSVAGGGPPAAQAGSTPQPRPHRLSVSLDGRQLVRALQPASCVRATQVRHQIRVAGRAAPPAPAPAPAPASAALLTSLVHTKTLHLPKGGQKIAISGASVGTVGTVNVGGAGGVQALSLGGTQLKARHPRLLAHARPKPIAEIVEASPAPGASSSNAVTDTGESGARPGDDANGVRARPPDTLPMEVT